MSTAFVFPGQGSQSVGMLKELAEAFPVVEQTYAQASAVLGFDLWQLVQNGPEEKLNETSNTQPAMLAAGVACWRVWQENNGETPAIMAGHSLGEYTALVCAGAIDFADAIALVSKRGLYMQEAVPAGTGAMAAILGLSDDQVKAVCEQAAQGEVLSPVNFNSPGQVVIAGNSAAVERGVAAAKEAGAKRAVPLPVSVPSHCSLMTPAAERLQQDLEAVEVKTPNIKVINNVDVSVAEQSQAIKQALVRQLYSPVRWVETVEGFAKYDVDKVIECGPGKVLAGLCKRIDRKLTASPLFSPDTLSALIQ